MAKRKKLFWDNKKLRELKRAAKAINDPGILAKKFETSEDSVKNALQYLENLKRLKNGKRKERINGKICIITMLKPGYALSAPQHQKCGKNAHWYL